MQLFIMENVQHPTRGEAHNKPPRHRHSDERLPAFGPLGRIYASFLPHTRLLPAEQISDIILSSPT